MLSKASAWSYVLVVVHPLAISSFPMSAALIGEYWDSDMALISLFLVSNEAAYFVVVCLLGYLCILVWKASF